MNTHIYMLQTMRRLLAVTGLMMALLFAAGPAAAEYIYRGLLIDGQGALDLRTNRFQFNPALSFNKDLNQIAAAPSNFRCALRMNTTAPIPNVGDRSPLAGFAIFTATFDQNPPLLPIGHVSVQPSPGVPVANPAQEFANDLRAEAIDNPERFNDRYIVGVPGRDSDDDCRDRPKSFNSFN